jgi:hypothetical protein
MHTFSLALLHIDTHAHTNLGADELRFPCYAFFLDILGIAMVIRHSSTEKDLLLLLLLLFLIIKFNLFSELKGAYYFLSCNVTYNSHFVMWL